MPDMPSGQRLDKDVALAPQRSRESGVLARDDGDQLARELARLFRQAAA